MQDAVKHAKKVAKRAMQAAQLPEVTEDNVDDLDMKTLLSGHIEEEEMEHQKENKRKLQLKFKKYYVQPPSSSRICEHVNRKLLVRNTVLAKKSRPLLDDAKKFVKDSDLANSSGACKTEYPSSSSK